MASRKKSTLYSEGGGKVIDLERLPDALKAVLSDYTEEIDAKITAIMTEELEETTKTLRATSPRKTGTYTYQGGEWRYNPTKVEGPYARSWKWRIDRSPYTGYPEGIVYSKTPYYRLTHLLEDGHAKKNGGKVEGIKHIGPAADQAAADFVRKVEEALSNG